MDKVKLALAVTTLNRIAAQELRRPKRPTTRYKITRDGKTFHPPSLTQGAIRNLRRGGFTVTIIE